MKFPRSSKILFSLGAALSLSLASTAFGDTIVLKSGEKVEGKLVLESDVMIKVEVKITESINETKTFARGDVAEIIKVAPDSVAFNEIQKLVPTRSLLSASEYTSMIETGPVSFKAKFPDSQHMPQVEEIEKTLREELDKVERKSIKIDNEWIGREEQLAKDMLIGSRISKFRYDQYYAAGNFIAALREFDTLESQYQGTPAHLDAIDTIDDLLQGYGSFLTKKLKNVDYLAAQNIEAQKRLDPAQLKQVQQARQNEVAQYASLQEKEKEAGIDWMTVDLKSKEDIEGTIKQVTEALDDAREMDPKKIGGSVEKLVQADELIFQGELKKAEELLEEIGVSPKKPSKKASSSKSKKKAGSYREHIASRLGGALQDREEAIKQAVAEGDAKALVSEIVGKKSGVEEDMAADAPPEEGMSALEKAMMKKKEAAEAERLAAAESEAKQADREADKAKKDAEKEEKKKSRPAADDSGGGISFTMIMIIFVVIMGGVIGFLKFKGIGDKKKEGDE